MARLSGADMEAGLASAAEVGSAPPQCDRADVWFVERNSRMLGFRGAA